jgi:hypothetical protein
VFLYDDELLRILVGKRTEQHSIDHTEYRGVCADAESEGEDGDSREARGLAQHARAVANILRQVLEPFPAPRDAAFFLLVRCVAKPAPSSGPSFVCRHAGLELFLLPQFQMQAHLLFEVGIKLSAMHQHAEAPCKFAQPVHNGAPFRPLQSHA